MYYGQFLLDKYLHETFFIDKKNGFFVECGACDGLLESTCRFFEESMCWTGVNIEAAPPLFSMLIKNRPNCINLNVGLSDKNDIATFTHAIHPNMGTRFGNGSLTHHSSHTKDLINQGCSFEKFQVKCDKFSELYNKEISSFSKEIDLFVLDVEGHELQAIDGMLDLDIKVLPKIFCIEHSFSGINNITNKLKNTYILHSLHQHNAIYIKK
jgi:FkbM family methyltransferase